MKKDVINYIWTDKKRTIFGLPISFTRYFLTEDKFITRKGFLSIEEDELDLYRVIDKKLVLPFGQRMFGCGTIVMNVKDVDTPIKEVKSIKAPRDVLAQLDKYININRDRYRVRGRDMVGGDGGHCHDHDDFDINDDIIYSSIRIRGFRRSFCESLFWKGKCECFQKNIFSPLKARGTGLRPVKSRYSYTAWAMERKSFLMNLIDLA